MILLVLAVLRVCGAVKCSTLSSDYAGKGWKATPNAAGYCSSNVALEAGETCTIQCDTDAYPLLGKDFEMVCPSAASNDQAPKGTTACVKLIRGSEAKRTYKQVWDNSNPAPASMLGSTYAWLGCNDDNCGNSGISCTPGQIDNPCADQWMQIETEEVSGTNPFVQGLVTQGRADVPSQYVTQFKVQATQRNDGTGFVDVKNMLDNTLLFDPSLTSTQDEMVFHSFDKPYQAKFIKITVTGSNEYRAMRAAYLMCGKGFSSGCTPRSCMVGEFGRIGACKECPNGFMTSGPSKAACDACADGKFNIGKKQSFCPGNCKSVPGQASTAKLTCTSATDSRITACALGLYKTDGVSGTSDTCTACTAVENAVSDATYTCTDATDSKVSACAAGYIHTTTTVPETCDDPNAPDDNDDNVDESEGAIWTASLLGSLLSSFIVVLASGRLLY